MGVLCRLKCVNLDSNYLQISTNPHLFWVVLEETNVCNYPQIKIGKAIWKDSTCCIFSGCLQKLSRMLRISPDCRGVIHSIKNKLGILYDNSCHFHIWNRYFNSYFLRLCVTGALLMVSINGCSYISSPCFAAHLRLLPHYLGLV